MRKLYQQLFTNEILLVMAADHSADRATDAADEPYPQMPAGVLLPASDIYKA
jgi:hypothetical protein